MPTRVDFYLLKSQDPQAVLLTACRIVEKAYHQGHRLYLVTENKQNAETLNKLLWTFHDISFIPHQIWSGKLEEDIPIFISDNNNSEPPPFYDILLNLTSGITPQFEQYQRIIEIVSGNPLEREKSREKYRIYRNKQCNLNSHSL